MVSICFSGLAKNKIGPDFFARTDYAVLSAVRRLPLWYGPLYRTRRNRQGITRQTIGIPAAAADGQDLTVTNAGGGETRKDTRLLVGGAHGGFVAVILIVSNADHDGVCPNVRRRIHEAGSVRPPLPYRTHAPRR